MTSNNQGPKPGPKPEKQPSFQGTIEEMPDGVVFAADSIQNAGETVPMFYDDPETGERIVVGEALVQAQEGAALEVAGALNETGMKLVKQAVLPGISVSLGQPAKHVEPECDTYSNDCTEPMAHKHGSSCSSSCSECAGKCHYRCPMSRY